jgi:16S rRNA (adenine1518-N6/adenine1519-N6)-dimethyltransferase
VRDLPRDVSPNQQLGQNFLMDERVLAREVELAGIAAGDTVLEVGAGIGNLTGLLARRAGQVVAVERDRQFAARLDGLTARHPNVSVIWGDARTVRLPRFDRVVANLPYRVALPVLFRLLEHPFTAGLIMVQQDMARHICAGPGEAGYGRLSVTVQRLASAQLLETVPRTAFAPAPDVDSALVRLRPAGNPFPVASDAAFRRLLDYLFLHRDDRLIGALQRLDGARAVAPLLPGRLRGKQVIQLTPAEFGEVSRFLDARDVALPVVSDSVKRRAQQLRQRPSAARRQGSR